jgi:hypothetical protein
VFFKNYNPHQKIYIGFAFEGGLRPVHRGRTTHGHPKPNGGPKKIEIKSL